MTLDCRGVFLVFIEFNTLVNIILFGIRLFYNWAT